jgi:CheY-like chemotaxis protein
MLVTPDPASTASRTDAQPSGEGPSGRSQLDLLTAQIRAVDAWARSNRLTQDAAEVISASREKRLDLSHRMEARRREQAALIARVDQQLRASGQPIVGHGRVRAVLAHRNEWLAGRVASRLGQHGVVVVGIFGDGADAAGAIVAEQPELVLLQDRLPSLTGRDLVQRVREFSPLSVIGAHVEDSRSITPLSDVGAHAVFTRRIPPSDIADQLLSCLREAQ